MIMGIITGAVGEHITCISIFGLKAHYISAQWQRPERTTPWVDEKREQ